MKKPIIILSGLTIIATVAVANPVSQLASSSLSITDTGPRTTADFYAAGSDDTFESYAMAAFTTFSSGDFGGTLTGINSATFTLTVNDRTFSDGDAIRIVLSTDPFGGDYSALSFNTALSPATGFDASQYTNAFDLGVYNLAADIGTYAGGTTIDFNLVLDGAAETALVNAINSAAEFNLSIHATDISHDVTFSGVGNTFDPGDPSLTIDAVVVPEPSTYALLFGALVIGLVAFRRRR